MLQDRAGAQVNLCAFGRRLPDRLGDQLSAFKAAAQKVGAIGQREIVTWDGTALFALAHIYRLAEMPDARRAFSGGEAERPCC